MVATPHVRRDYVTDVTDLHDRVPELRAAVGAAGLAVAVRPGGELGHDMVGRLGQARPGVHRPGTPGCRWLLVETPFEGVSEDFHAATAELRDRGFGVLVAHPERSADAQEDGARGLRREITSGACAQVNAQSITGDTAPEREPLRCGWYARAWPRWWAPTPTGPPARRCSPASAAPWSTRASTRAPPAA